MNDPSRLLDGEATEAERALLEAGAREQPSQSGVRKAAAALGVAAVISGSSAVATASKAGVAATLQWVALALIGGSGLVLGALWLAPGSSQPTAPTPAASVIAPSALPVRAPAPEAVPCAEPAPQPAPARAAPAAAASPASSLREETALIDEARRTLGSGNASGAIATLDRYARTYPRGMLREEATLLRIEALAQAGNRSAAADLARRFLASHPGSPHAKRLSSLLGGSR